ncbi:MAG TPA: YncE family protein [Thermoanaerobaculia bacterium]|nr:YncE family protein [Thermoanaerobaculia bacterium]
MSIRKLVFLSLLPALFASAGTPQKVERDGVTVELLSAEATAGEDVTLRFSVHGDDGLGLRGIRPAAWIDARKGSTTCKDKIQSFLGGTLRARPVVDLNSYHVITLNVEPSVAVIDPLVGFGGSKLLTAVTLLSPGVDWALTRDQRRLFVSMPLVNRVAAIDTETWEVMQNIETAFRPARLVLDAEERLWVTHQNERAGDPSLSVIDTKSLTVLTTLATGRAPHQLAFDGTRALVTNGSDGTVSVIEAMKRVANIATGPSPYGIAVSSLSNAAYVIDRDDGSISVLNVGRASARLSTRIAAKPGHNSIQFAPGGRWAFVTNGKENTVYILDSATAKIVTVATDVGKEPDHVAFTDDFAYVRAAGSDQVKMIRLGALGQDANANIATFPGGQLPPAAAETISFAPAIVPAPEPKAVLVANPADRLVYYYMEGMAAPMGNFRAAKRSPKAAMVIDRSLRESEPGIFTIRTKVPAAGTYDVAFFLNAPRVVHCFDLAVKGAPQPTRGEVAIETILDKKPILAGEELEVRFRLTDAGTREPHHNATDVHALAFLTPGTWQQRFALEPGDDGTYRVRLPVPKAGIYYVFLESDSLRLRVNAGRPLIFEAVER